MVHEVNVFKMLALVACVPFWKLKDHKLFRSPCCHCACLSSFLVPAVDNMVEDKFAKTFYDVPHI